MSPPAPLWLRAISVPYNAPEPDLSQRCSWEALALGDQARLEAALAAGQDFVPLEGGRCEANLSERRMFARFWREAPRPLRRATWFADGLPYPEDQAAVLEAWHAAGCPGPLRLDAVQVEMLEMGEIVERGATLFGRSRAVVRGKDGFLGSIPDNSAEEKCGKIGHLVLTVHGIGEALASQQFLNTATLITNTGALRQATNEQMAALLAANGVRCSAARVEILPVEWHQAVHEEDAELQARLGSVTLPSVPALRRLSNDCLADAIMYAQGSRRDKILHCVAAQLNSIVAKFLRVNQLPRGQVPVSLVGHSLGSVILHDLLRIQEDADLPPPLRLSFRAQALFLLGSPLGLFRSVAAEVGPVALPGGTRLFNVFQPTDPVAYRMEPLLAPDAALLPPCHVPHFLTGEVRPLVRLSDAASKLWAVPAELLGARGLWGAVSQVGCAVEALAGRRRRGSAEEERAAGAEERVRLANGDRLDWVLQETSLAETVASEYLSAVGAHLRYFQEPDLARFLLDKTGHLSLCGVPSAAQ